MQISRISQNYPNKTKTSFKGAVEKELFIASVEGNFALKNVMTTAKTTGAKTLTDFFTSVFEKLKLHLGQTSKLQESQTGRNFILHKPNGESIHISLERGENGKSNPILTYLEKRPPIEEEPREIEYVRYEANPDEIRKKIFGCT